MRSFKTIQTEHVYENIKVVEFTNGKRGVYHIKKRKVIGYEPPKVKKTEEQKLGRRIFTVNTNVIDRANKYMKDKGLNLREFTDLCNLGYDNARLVFMEQRRMTERVRKNIERILEKDGY